MSRWWFLKLGGPTKPYKTRGFKSEMDQFWMISGYHLLKKKTPPYMYVTIYIILFIVIYKMGSKWDIHGDVMVCNTNF